MLALGCDHGGYELMQEVKKHLENRGIAYHDFGCSSTESVDYPIYGKKVAEAVARGELNPDLRNRNRYFHRSQQGKRHPCCTLHRLLLCRGNETAQRCQHSGNGRPRGRSGTCPEDRRYVP